MKTEN